MNVSYRVFQEESGQYTFREVFTEHDGQLISYSRSVIAPKAGTLDELTDEVAAMQAALGQPVLTTDEIDEKIARQGPSGRRPRRSISHAELLAKLGLETDEPAETTELSVVGQRN